MVANCDAFDLAVELSKNHEIKNNIGVHFNLTESIPLSEHIKQYPLFVRDGKFHGEINRLKLLSHKEKQAVYEELSAQIAKIEAAGIRVTHADSHHHIHTGIFIAPIVLRVCKEHGIRKIRMHRNIGAISTQKKMVKKCFNAWLHMRGFRTTQFFGSLEDIGLGIPNGVTEIMVHPDYDKNGDLIDRVDMDGIYPIGERLNNLPKLQKENRFSYNEL